MLYVQTMVCRKKRISIYILQKMIDGPSNVKFVKCMYHPVTRHRHRPSDETKADGKWGWGAEENDSEE
jgi:hypothetical protein